MYEITDLDLDLDLVLERRGGVRDLVRLLDTISQSLADP